MSNLKASRIDGFIILTNILTFLATLMLKEYIIIALVILCVLWLFNHDIEVHESKRGAR